MSITISLPSGDAIALDSGATALDLAKKISPRLAKEAVGALINNEPRDILSPLTQGDTVKLLTFSDELGKEMFWHSSAHILAEAVQTLFSDAKIAIGPPIENGFYYDFEVERPFTTEDFAAIEKKFKEIASQKREFTRREVSAEEARELFEKRNEPYKLELIEGLNEQLSIYSQGHWEDLCRGPHIQHSGQIKAFKILSNAGAYWRGDENRPMLQRLYAISFPKASMLDEHLHLLEEAKKRDHRKIGKALGLFSFQSEGTGFPFWHPNGMVIYNEITDYCRKKQLSQGYEEIRTPVILNESLWRRSGHWDKYRENMYFTDIDEQAHAVKPMNCPGCLLIYNTTPHSYRDLPRKYFEFGLVHRHEKAGVLHGLFRVRQFTQDDAHIFCLPDQLETEIAEVIDFITDVYKTFGFSDYQIELSTRPEQYIGSDEVWQIAEAALESVLKKKQIDFQLNEGDGAFYGPKIDFHIRDSLGRSWQCGTIQVDFSMPERFDLTFVDSDGAKKRPVMIHRAILGSIERFLGILIEHYAGNLPLWLSPNQLRIIAVSDAYADYAQSVANAFKEKGIRLMVDQRSEKVGYKIRDAEINKVNYMAVIGQKELDSQTVSLRKHGEGDIGSFTLDQAVEKLASEVEAKQ